MGRGEKFCARTLKTVLHGTGSANHFVHSFCLPFWFVLLQQARDRGKEYGSRKDGGSRREGGNRRGEGEQGGRGSRKKRRSRKKRGGGRKE